mgnify:CR=1 FL=1
MKKEILRSFFQSNFHLDWIEDYETTEEVIVDFCRTKAEIKIAVRNALQEALDEQAVGEKFVQQMKGAFVPSLEGYSAEEWVKMAIKMIDEDLDAKGQAE